MYRITQGTNPACRCLTRCDYGVGLWYEKAQVPTLDGYSYVAGLPNNDPEFSFVDSGVIIDVSQPQDLDHAVVTSLTIMTKPISITDVISSFGRDPDRITSYELVYVDEQITLRIINSSEGLSIDSVRLYNQEGIDLTLMFDPDIRPCIEPAALCTLPRPASVLAFTLGGDVLASPVAYRPNLEITAEIDPQQVGSVVFTDGETTVIDDTSPYTWTIPAPGFYLLRARPYSETGGQGTAGTPLSVAFTVTVPAGCQGAPRNH